MFIFEGLTEFLVGCVLKNTLAECYKEWQIVDAEFCFASSYTRFVKPWLFLSKKIGAQNFNEIIKIYFDIYSDNPLESMDQVLRAKIGPKYDLSFKEKMCHSSLFDDFKDTLGTIYGKEFTDFQRTHTQIIEM